MPKKIIAVLGSGASCSAVCIEALVEAGYEVQTEGLDADGFVVFDLFPHTLQTDMTAATISAPVFWLSMFEVETDEPIKSLPDVTFDLVNFSMDSRVFFTDLACRMTEKVPLQ